MTTHRHDEDKSNDPTPQHPGRPPTAKETPPKPTQRHTDGEPMPPPGHEFEEEAPPSPPPPPPPAA